MGKRTYLDVKEYVECQCKGKSVVLSAKPEQEFDDLGVKVSVWNVKTDNDGDWWVVEGDEVPMNLYSQNGHYFSSDEAYSFHMGLMARLNAREDDYSPAGFVEAATLGIDIAPQLFRKLKNVATLSDNAIELEEFQAVGVQCREILIALGNEIYRPQMTDGQEEPKGADFKNKAELFVQYYLKGSENKEYRSIIKKITESVWEYANKITHAKNTTKYEASTCVMLCVSLVGIYENIMEKVFDPLSQYYCSICKSKDLDIVGDEGDDDGIIHKLYLRCKECGATTEVVFEENNKKDRSYIKGKVIE